MRRVLSLLCALALLLTACGRTAPEPSDSVTPEPPPTASTLPSPTRTPSPTPTPEPTPETTPEAEFYFTRENFPVLDGSTSMVPLAEAAAGGKTILVITHDEELIQACCDFRWELSG